MKHNPLSNSQQNSSVPTYLPPLHQQRVFSDFLIRQRLLSARGSVKPYRDFLGKFAGLSNIVGDTKRDAVRSMSTYVLSRITYCVVFLSFGIYPL
jgi:hypothetical protein